MARDCEDEMTTIEQARGEAVAGRGEALGIWEEAREISGLDLSGKDRRLGKSGALWLHQPSGHGSKSQLAPCLKPGRLLPPSILLS